MKTDKIYSRILLKSLTAYLLYVSLIILASSFSTPKSKCKKTPDGYYIQWHKNIKLEHSDFKARKKLDYENPAASTYSGFGYEITDYNGEITGSIFVRFYCRKSWFNPEIKKSEKINYLLLHEQLHFDICELFGRKLYKEIVRLIKSNKLNQQNIERVQSKLEKQYSYYQDKYDKETNHSINKIQQLKWESKIKKELAAISNYSDYTNF